MGREGAIKKRSKQNKFKSDNFKGSNSKKTNIGIAILNNVYWSLNTTERLHFWYFILSTDQSNECYSILASLLNKMPQLRSWFCVHSSQYFNKISMRNRQCRYWQIAKHRILVAWYGIKMRCSNTPFMANNLRKLSRKEVIF